MIVFDSDWKSVADVARLHEIVQESQRQQDQIAERGWPAERDVHGPSTAARNCEQRVTDDLLRAEALLAERV